MKSLEKEMGTSSGGIEIQVYWCIRSYAPLKVHARVSQLTDGETDFRTRQLIRLAVKDKS